MRQPLHNQKIISWSAMPLIIMLLSGCCKLCAPQDDFEMDLKWTYRGLWPAKGGMEYPPNKEILELCWQGRDH
jgi:hypothetical protein